MVILPLLLPVAISTTVASAAGKHERWRMSDKVDGQVVKEIKGWG
jgi:hypothetical protein